MVRGSQNGQAACVDGTVHGDGLTSLQFRRTLGADTEEIKAAITGADVIQLARQGTTFTLSVARYGEPFVTSTLAGRKTYLFQFRATRDHADLAHASGRQRG
jgi:hypothetical protein